MDDDLLKSLGTIGGFSGIAIGMIILIFRDLVGKVVRDNLFPKLTKSQGYKLLMLIVVSTWSVAVSAIWISYHTESNISNTEPLPVAAPVTEEKGLTCVDIYVYQASLGQAELNITVLNYGSRTATITRLKLTALEITEEQIKQFQGYDVEYDLDISSIRNIGDVAEVLVSHTVKPGESDRFQVVVAASNLGIGAIKSWSLRPTLLTDKGEISCVPEKIEIKLQPVKD